MFLYIRGIFGAFTKLICLVNARFICIITVL